LRCAVRLCSSGYFLRILYKSHVIVIVFFFRTCSILESLTSIIAVQIANDRHEAFPHLRMPDELYIVSSDDPIPVSKTSKLQFACMVAGCLSFFLKIVHSIYVQLSRDNYHSKGFQLDRQRGIA
jgi:hypothetical protein